MNRRELLKSSVSAAAMLALPKPALAAMSAPVAKATRPMKWFIVGTPGESDWAAILFETAEQARAQWFQEKYALDVSNPDDAKEIAALGVPEVEEMPRWSGKSDIFPKDWVLAGFGTFCERCFDETNSAHIINEEVVCGYCMTDRDWIESDLDDCADHLINMADRSDLESVKAKLVDWGLWEKIPPSEWADVLECVEVA
ncbi:MAG: hypothetical protein AAF468_12485 [Pseudomonadota bacterium]